MKTQRKMEQGTFDKLRERNGILEIFLMKDELHTSKLVEFKTELPLRFNARKDRVWYCVSGLVRAYRSPFILDATNCARESYVQTFSDLQPTLMQPGDAIYIRQLDVYGATNLDAYETTILELIPGKEEPNETELLYVPGKTKFSGITENLTLPELIKMCKEETRRK
jgi:hypothetical protein